MKKQLIAPAVTIATLVIVLVAALVYAKQPGNEQPLNDPRVLKQIGATEEQQKQLRDSWVESYKKTIELKAKWRIARIELEQTLRSEKVDRGEVEKKIDEIAKINGDLLRAKVARRITAKETLTPEQCEKLQKITRNKMRERLEQQKTLRKERTERRKMLLKRLEYPLRYERRIQREDERPRVEEPSRRHFRMGESGDIESFENLPELASHSLEFPEEFALEQHEFNALVNEDPERRIADLFPEELALE